MILMAYHEEERHSWSAQRLLGILVPVVLHLLP